MEVSRFKKAPFSQDRAMSFLKNTKEIFNWIWKLGPLELNNLQHSSYISGCETDVIIKGYVPLWCDTFTYPPFLKFRDPYTSRQFKFKHFLYLVS